MTKITFIGIGAVGGYFGGLLAKHFQHSKEVEIYFVAKGENLKAMEEKGLTLETTHGNYHVRPQLVTSNPSEIGVVDYLIYCTKGYDLEESLAQLRPCIGPETVILPLLNGVDSRDRIKTIYPSNEVWDGCVYLVSRLTEPGVVKETGTIRSLFFGAPDGTLEKQLLLERIFTEASIQATFSSHILETIWEKFSFISVLATITSYHDKIIGDILPDPHFQPELLALLQEIKSVVEAEGIDLGTDIIQKTLDKFAKMPYGTMSSMHADFQKEKSTEVRSLTGHIVGLGQKHGIPTPVYQMMYEKLTMSFDHYSLRLLSLDDSPSFFSLINNNLDRFGRYFPFTVRETTTLEETKKHVSTRVARAEKKEYYTLVIEDNRSHQIVRVVSLKDVDWNIPKVEFGYFIDRQYEGKGIVTKSISLAIYYCFQKLKMNKVFMRIQQSNIPSRRVAEKNGFVLEGVLRNDFKSLDGELMDCMYYGLLR